MVVCMKLFLDFWKVHTQYNTMNTFDETLQQHMNKTTLNTQLMYNIFLDKIQPNKIKTK